MKTWKHWAFTGFFSVIAFIACDNGNNIPSPQPTIDEIDFGVGAVFSTHNFNNAVDLLAFWNDHNLASGNYVINVAGNIDLGNDALGSELLSDRSGIVISLRGINGAEITSSEGGSADPRSAPVLRIDNGQKIILRNITLNRINNEWNSVDIFSSNSTLVLQSGSVITGGSHGVRVINGGTFLMEGGEIFGNSYGVLIANPNSHFKKTGGIIFGHGLDGKTNTNLSIRVLLSSVAALAYREDTVADALSITINSTGDGIASQTGVWVNP